MPADLELHISIVTYDVACLLCGWAARLRSEQLGQVNGHHSPVLLALRSRFDGGPVETWVCRRPRRLR